MELEIGHLMECGTELREEVTLGEGCQIVWTQVMLIQENAIVLGLGMCL